MHMVLAAGNSLSLLPVVSVVRILWHLCIEKCSISQDQMSQGLIPAVLHFFICLLYWCAILFTYAAAHNFGWDDTGGTGDWNKFGANNEICGRDCKTGETIKHNQPHTQVDFRAFQSLRFHSLPRLNIHGVIWTTEDKIGPRAYLQFSKDLNPLDTVTCYWLICVSLYRARAVWFEACDLNESSTVCLDWLSECACWGSDIMHL